MLNELKQRGLLKARGRQRTDATHVLAGVRAVHRVVCVGETDAVRLSIAWRRWLPSGSVPRAPDEWYERYAHRIEAYRLPKGKEQRKEFVETVGAAPFALLEAIFTTPEVDWLQHVRALEILRRVWVQQFEVLDGHWRFRADETIPPTAKMICSPYDIEATYGNKLSSWWVG